MTVSEPKSYQASALLEKKSSSSLVAASPHWIPSSTSTEQIQSKKKKGFSAFVAFCFTLNYIFGIGFLTIPWAFVQGGLVLSLIFLVLVCILSDITKGFLIETMSRAEYMLDSNMHWKQKKGKQASNPHHKVERILYSPKNINPCRVERNQGHEDEEEALLKKSSPSAMLSLSTTPDRPKSLGDKRRLMQSHKLIIPHQAQQEEKEPLVIKDRKFEINTLCRIYCGKLGSHLYTLILCFYLYGALWAFVSVFSNALSKSLPLFSHDSDKNYTYFTLIYACIVIPLSCLELHDQIVVQVSLSICMFTMVLIMIVTSSSFEMDPSSQASLINWEGIPKMLPILVFSSIYHHSIPGLSAPIEDKTKIGLIFRSTTIASSIAYGLIGCVLGSVFGTQIEQSCNLHWKAYHDINQFIGMFVTIFPGLYVVSAFPLSAITLGNNMLHAVFTTRVHEIEQHHKSIVCLFRLLAAIPPIIMGALIRELGTITDYTGTIGFLITYCVPALLYWCSYQKAIELGFSPDATRYTTYSNYSSSKYLAISVFLFGLAMFVFVFIMLLRESIV